MTSSKDFFFFFFLDNSIVITIRERNLKSDFRHVILHLSIKTDLKYFSS